MREAGVPEEVEFATKPVLARQMVTRALTAGVPARWATGDEVYGSDPQLRTDPVSDGIGYVLAIAKDHRITTGIGVRKAAELAVRLPSPPTPSAPGGSGC